MKAATVVRTSRLTRTISCRQQRQKRQMLEPVLENYISGSNSVLSERHHDLPDYNPATSHVICNKPSNSKSPKRSSSTALINPMNLLGKLRDRYVKLMNEVAMSGDFTSMASYGCQIAPDYPGTLEISRASKEQRDAGLATTSCRSDSKRVITEKVRGGNPLVLNEEYY